jgi:uncharacterized delta-60 repeat protein
MKANNKANIRHLIQICLLTCLSAAFSNAQIERWVYTHDGAANSIVYGLDNNLYAAGYSTEGGTGRDFAVITLDTTGNEVKADMYNGPANDDDEAYDLTYGLNGEIYAAGYSCASGGQNYADFIVASSKPWLYRYDGAGSPRPDEAYEIVYGLDNNIYVAGYTYWNWNFSDFTVVSLDTLGNERWFYHYDTTSFFDEAFTITYGTDDNIYAAGYCMSDAVNEDIVVISLDTEGNENWVYMYDGPDNGIDHANAIIYGLDGNIYVAGYSDSANYDFVVISLNNMGEENWVYRYNGSANDLDEANAIVYGLDGNIYVAGYATNTGTARDFIVISLTPIGTENWVYKYNGTANWGDCAYSIVYGSNNSIYATGYTETGMVGEKDIVAVGLTTNGTNKWKYTYGTTNGEAKSIIYGLDGYIYVAGATGSFTVISLDEAPDIEILTVWPDTSFTGPYPVDAKISDNVEVTSASLYHRKNIGNWESISMTLVSGDTFTAQIPEADVGDVIDYYIEAVDQASNSTVSDTITFNVYMGVEENYSQSNLTFYLAQNTPNPFMRNRGTTISYSIPNQCKVNLSIYNAIGQKVKTLVNELKQSGTYKVFWNGHGDSGEQLANGVYFCRIDADRYSETRHMLILE